jgi:hypothetical protein
MPTWVEELMAFSGIGLRRDEQLPCAGEKRLRAPTRTRSRSTARRVDNPRQNVSGLIAADDQARAERDQLSGHHGHLEDDAVAIHRDFREAAGATVGRFGGSCHGAIRCKFLAELSREMPARPFSARSATDRVRTSGDRDNSRLLPALKSGSDGTKRRNWTVIRHPMTRRPDE